MKDLFWPDHSVCITCKKPISWDDYSYTHDDTGFADCGIALDLDPVAHGVSLVKEIHQFTRYEGATARPEHSTDGISVNSISTDEADEIRWGDSEGVELMGKQLVSEHRWYNNYLIVFRLASGELRGFYHMDPLTEAQEGQEEYETDPVETFPVTGEEKTIIVYKPAS